MAQRDIQEIAEYMKQLNESKIAEDQAYEAACREEEELYAKEDEELEDEVIDPASMGFIDSSTDESDSFYAEEDEEQRDPFSEDVSDCLEKEVVEAEQQATIEVEVYNEDGFGEHFAEEVSKNVPGVDAKVKKTLENGDLVVTLRGSKDDLEKAFAFYLGKKTFAEVSQDDKDSFETILTFDDGDTLAEADYREAVAHCLDPIDVKASTANLVGKDTCTISMVKEEKARRSAKRILKALQEADFSQLPDADLDALDRIKDAIDADARMDDKDRRVWLAVLKDMGYTEEEWNKLTPEQQQKIWDYESTPLPKSNFGDGVHVEVDPKTGKPFRYRNSYEVYDPKTGEKLVTTFNPDYSDEKSPYQHPSAAKRQAKKDAAAVEQAGKEQAAREAMKKASGKDTWDKEDFAKMIVALDGKQRKALMDELIADVEKDNAENPEKAGEEIMFIKNLFGKKITLRDIAKAWGKSAPGVMKFSDETIGIWQKTLRDFGINSVTAFKAMPAAKFDQFLQALKTNMSARRKGSIVSGR